MAAGVASPSAQGQATTRTATALSTAEVQLAPSPKTAQATNVITATKTTVGDEDAGDSVGQALHRGFGMIGRVRRLR